MNKQLSFPQRIVKAIFFLGVYFLKKVFPLDPNASKLLAEAKPGTTGYVVKKSLERNQLELVPKFESHDLKHAVLDLEMTPLDETRLQDVGIDPRRFFIGHWMNIAIRI